MIRITLTFLCLTMTLLTFGQGKNQEKWEKIISEMTKANKGDTISLRSKKSLEWSDFKMSPEVNKDLKAHLELIFGVYSKKVNVWTGVITVESYGGIRRDLSWVNPQYTSQQHLNYFQLKYEIAHFFAKKSEKEINSRKINAGNVNKINGIIETYLNARDKALSEFDTESNFGDNVEVVDKWRQKLNNNEI
ncbi:hypothetical protein [Flavobacterium sp. RSSB_23]|uniref:hypothetical protein n=1 Tax=Flavobacterium sp. RSSB_23 TaxID=3447668 RepID=UPI003F2E7414